MLRTIQVPAPHGRLEGLLDEQAAVDPVAVSVICHPHPALGGTMHNVVVYRMAKAMARRGIATLRFNFRGIGTSTGTSEATDAELDDVRAALRYLGARHVGAPLWAAGFSFGAWAALRVGSEEVNVHKLLGVGLVTSWFDFGFLRGCPKPKALVQGADDELVRLAEVQSVVADASEPKRLDVVEGAGHLFARRLAELDVALDRSIAFLLTTERSQPVPR